MSTDRLDHRLEELLAQEATQGLNPAEAAELDALLVTFPNEDPDAFEYAAAAIHLALSPPPERLPAWLAEKLELAAVAFTPSATPATPKRSRPASIAWAGWVVAACLAGVLVFTNWPKPQETLGVLASIDVPKPPEPTLAQKRDALLKDASAKAVAFSGGQANITGSVVWSTAKQEGYLEVRGLPALDPKAEQYQLWIVDPAHKEPVDGGVFDVKPDGTTLIRVRNPIQVRDAKVFAITKEIAGGVPVSKQPKHELVLTPKQG